MTTTSNAPARRADLTRVAAIVPVRSIATAKTRLGESLDAEERQALVTGLLERTLRALSTIEAVNLRAVVSPDPAVLELAVAEGAVPIRGRGAGLNEDLDAARAWAIENGATALLVLPADLPAASATEVSRLLGRAAEATRGTKPAPLVLVVPDHHGTGTNALLISPPDAIPFAFGQGSRGRHLRSAERRRATIVELEGPLSLDLDTTEDLLLADPGLVAELGAIEPPAEVADGGELTGRVEIVALAGIPEVETGADLGALIGDAIESTAGLLPLRSDDVLVVTQKVVSKAEGAVVDLRAVRPRPEAVEFAARWQKDARQVEVVLREAKRIVRMERGVLITETAHGFVLANSGVDASNVGPRTGAAVTLLPRDPDGSAARMRAALRERFGVDLAVIVSDSFGRPWRWGIVDVAIGVSGLQPLDDLRGQPDADGRIMHATVRAVADEIASAAELALGKTSGRPAALVRGAAPRRTEGTVAETVMPSEFDLFR